MLVRSRWARACTRVSLLVTFMVSGAATANAATQAEHVQAQALTLDALGGPVGPLAVGLGVIGMVAGVLRRKKVTVQPENERKS